MAHISLPRVMRAIIFNLVAAVVNARGGSKRANPQIQKRQSGIETASTTPPVLAPFVGFGEKGPTPT